PTGTDVAHHPGTGSAPAGNDDVKPGSAAAPGSAATPDNPGSAGSASAGSAAPPPPKGPLVDAEIAANVAKATVVAEGTGQAGAAPLQAKLERDQPYKAKISAPGSVAEVVTIKGGQDKITAKLLAKPRLLSVSSDPPGAAIFIDNAPTGKTTPSDVELSA